MYIGKQFSPTSVPLTLHRMSQGCGTTEMSWCIWILSSHFSHCTSRSQLECYDHCSYCFHSSSLIAVIETLWEVLTASSLLDKSSSLFVLWPSYLPQFLHVLCNLRTFVHTALSSRDNSCVAYIALITIHSINLSLNMCFFWRTLLTAQIW